MCGLPPIRFQESKRRVLPCLSLAVFNVPEQAAVQADAPWESYPLWKEGYHGKINLPFACLRLTSGHKQRDPFVFLSKRLPPFGKRDIGLPILYRAGSPEEGIQVVPLKQRASRAGRLLLSAFSAFSEAKRQQAQVYHFHDPELLLCGLLLRLCGKKVVYDVHEDVPRQIMAKTWIATPLRRIASILFEGWENLCARCMSGIVAATPVIEQRYRKKNKNTVNVNNYPILSEFLPLSAEQKEKHGGLCYLGDISPIRGIRELVSALEHTQAGLLLAGRYESENLKSEMESLPGYDKVEYLGYLDRKGVANALERANIGMVTLHPTPNYLVSLPIKLFEYMAAGLPCIVSNFPYWRELVGEADCALFVDPLSPQEIAQAAHKSALRM